MSAREARSIVTVTGAGTSAADGEYVPNGEHNQKPQWKHASGSGYELYWRDVDEGWVLADDESESDAAYVHRAATSLPQTTGWVVHDGEEPAPVLAFSSVTTNGTPEPPAPPSSVAPAPVAASASLSVAAPTLPAAPPAPVAPTNPGPAEAASTNDWDESNPAFILLTLDGKVKKRVDSAGAGACPRPGDRVVVQYTGYFRTSSEVFDTSRRRPEPFAFLLGRGQVIKGWDVAVTSMKKGEQARVLIKFDYAYGSKGLPPRIPGHSDLAFDIELLDFTTPSGVPGNAHLPAIAAGPANPSQRDEGVQTVMVGGAPIHMDKLGPMVLNTDGTFSRISNWHEMTVGEQQKTLRLIGRRNRKRREQLEKSQ